MWADQCDSELITREGLEAAQEQQDLVVELNKVGNINIFKINIINLQKITQCMDNPFQEESRVRREARLEPLTGISITNNFEVFVHLYSFSFEFESQYYSSH